MAAITENNLQYNAGTQKFFIETGGGGLIFQTTFDTDLKFHEYTNAEVDYHLNNFKLYYSTDGFTFNEYLSSYSVVNNEITVDGSLAANSYIVVQLKSIPGGNFGDKDAYGTTVEDNYGSYKYITLDDAIDNFNVGYVGAGKLIQKASRADIVFHAKRGLQEFSYDTLKAIKGEEITVPPHLSVSLPQDFVNHVKVSRIDSNGVKHPILPGNRLTANPSENNIQDQQGQRVQDYWSNNFKTESIAEERFKDAEINTTQGNLDFQTAANEGYNVYGDGGFVHDTFGNRFGGTPEHMNFNGYYYINEREGSISFSSDLANTLIIFEYISDGLAYDSDIKIPKLAEQALYMHMVHGILSTRANVPEYVINRYKKERRAALRNAKLRLSNIKLEEITQVLRNQSKWIKH